MAESDDPRMLPWDNPEAEEPDRPARIVPELVEFLSKVRVVEDTEPPCHGWNEDTDCGCLDRGITP